MGQIIATIDETGVNELFRKVFNSWPDMHLPDVNVGAGNPAGAIHLGARQIKIRAVDYAPGARPIDLRGSTMTPNIAVTPLRFAVSTRLEASIHVNDLPGPPPGFDLQAAAPAVADVSLSGGAGVRIVNRVTDRLAVLDISMGAVQVNLHGNRPTFLAVVQQALGSVDANPFWPGRQPLPAPVIAALMQLAGALFDQAINLVQSAVNAALQNLVNALDLQLTYPVPRSFTIAAPGGGTITVNINGLVPLIDGNRITLTADFA